MMNKEEKIIDTCENRNDYWFKSWNYANKKAIDLQQRIDKAKELSDEIYNFIKCRNSNLFYEIEDLLIKQDEILGGKE